MINIIPYDQKKIIRKIRYMRIATISLVATILLIAIAIVLFLPTLHTINTRYAIATNNISILEKSGVVIKEINVIELKRKSKSIVDKLAVPLPPSPLEYINIIRKYEKEGVKINGFVISNIENRTLEIQGVATTRQNLQNFISALQTESTIESINSPVTNFIKNNQAEFIITVIFKPL